MVTASLKDISLLDAIVVTYVLILPIVASAFGVAELAAQQSSREDQPTVLRRAHSPLLILANWLRSALTYALALFVWGTAPNFGQGPPECDRKTRLIFFGASLPALGSGRTLNLTGWGILTALFAWRTLKGSWTLLAALQGLFSENVLLKPKDPPKNELNLETMEKYNYVTGDREVTERAYRPGQVFHEMIKGMMNQILGWAPTGQGRWYRKYGQLILATLIATWAITMTELELRLNDIDASDLNKWGFGQILPLILTISPLFALFEAVLKKRSRGPLESSKRTLRFCIRRATNLTRPRTELDGFSTEQIQQLIEDEQLTQEYVDQTLAPSPFALLTVGDKDVYNTYALPHTGNPDWQEYFDADVADTTTIVIRIFDSKCMDRGWPALIGYTTILPFAMFPPGSGGGNDVAPADDSSTPTQAIALVNQANRTQESGAQTFPLFRDRSVIPGMSLEFSVSSDVQSPLPPPNIAGLNNFGLQHVNERRNVAIFKWRGKTIHGKRQTRLTERYNMPE
ncbi:hypothetical protein MD484_g4683, partial [Candolleomyces efflorescens]